MSQIKPLGARVLIKRSKPPVTKGGILLPDSAQEKPKEGIVVAVGPGKVLDDGKIESMNVKVGNHVLFSSYAGTEVNKEEELLIMNEEEILGILA